MKSLKLLALLLVLALLGGGAFVYTGVFDPAADRSHGPVTVALLEWARERAIAVRARDIEVPNLEDPALLRTGGPDYDEMCAGCHRRPGQEESELSLGLYPAPPNFAQAAEAQAESAQAEAARSFWVVKHGLKMTGMPAWGLTHDDARIWAMVGFIRKLPELTPAQYQSLSARGAGEAGHHDHGAHPHPTTPAAAASGTPLATVEALHQALQSSDAAAVRGLLAPDVLIYESGGAERSRDEYLAHHMKGDMAFLAAATVDILRRTVRLGGATATVTSEARIRGTSAANGAVDVLSAETAVLAQTANGWQITHLHWSSRDYAPPAGHAH